MRLTTNTEPERVQTYYQREGTLLAFEIPSTIDPVELVTIARSHADWPQRGCVLNLVVSHPHCDPSTLEQVVELAEDDRGVLLRIATSGKASRALLERLHHSQHPSVREHAALALFELELDEADEAGIVPLYEQHRDHPTRGYGFRYRLLVDPRTPRAVLKSIAEYPDPIGAQARRRLSR